MSAGYPINGFHVCLTCGAYVPYNQYHCHFQQPQTNYYWPYVDPKQQEILDELKAIRKLLEDTQVPRE